MDKNESRGAEVRKENEEKKEYLRGYQAHVRRIHRINEEIREIRSMKESISIRIDGMPRGSGQEDLSGYVAELDSMERELIEERRGRYKAYREIVFRIKMLSSENENDVLFYRYIKGLDWPEIAEKLRYSERHIHRFHGRALVHFQLPKN